MKKYKKLAMFGGTFSPMHNGHLAALSAYFDKVKPDVVFVVPTAIPPHKERDDSVSDSDRLEMIRLAVDNLRIKNNVVVSDIEFKRGGKSYTVDTVEAFLEIAEEVCFFCGTDMLLTVDSWYKHEKLLRMASVAYMQREDDSRYAEKLSAKAKKLNEKYGTEIVALPPISAEISSSMVRRAIKEGKEISEFVPANVAKYILKNGLYR
ncbi:MAG: nicotinate (nicotinamide) nucleotide adenylyltransferase [Ruminococcaceae bacterium]|nr:nicotinate (nicotinamide) nucleotide adenylyltransferase [Oscillospiraceae bacterium]